MLDVVLILILMIDGESMEEMRGLTDACEDLDLNDDVEDYIIWMILVMMWVGDSGHILIVTIFNE